MTVVHNSNTSGSNEISMCCDGVLLSSRTAAAATVIAAGGEIDASNVHNLTEFATRHLDAGTPIIVDLSQVDFLGAQGIPALLEIGGRCGEAGVEWAVVPSHPVSRLLRICDKDGHLPTVSSVDEALQRICGPDRARRLLKLVTETV
jgi:anti-anti-sigma factor